MTHVRRLLLGLLLAAGVAFQSIAGWSDTVYVRFPNEATARAAAEAIGANFDAGGNPTSGSENYALVSPFTQWNRRPGTNGPDDAGDAAPGYWAMMRFNLDTQAGRDAYAAVMATGAVQTPATPSNVFQ